MRDRLIHSLRQAHGRWYQYRDKPSLEEALADAILAEFVVRVPRGIGWKPCRHCGHRHAPDRICIS